MLNPCPSSCTVSTIKFNPALRIRLMLNPCPSLHESGRKEVPVPVPVVPSGGTGSSLNVVFALPKSQHPIKKSVKNVSGSFTGDTFCFIYFRIFGPGICEMMQI